ncbi:MAG: Hsp20/alpha crystallin family protein [Chloroflexi bacterium]|nr:Hsp20/alpha crystallin family protein [Chloroflexota bacterium]
MAELTLWEPIREMMGLQRLMDRMIEETLGPWYRPAADSGRWNAPYVPVDIYTTDENVVILAALPGLRPEDVDITFEGNTITIRGEFPQPTEENINWHVQERYYGPFERIITLNIPVDMDHAEAYFENGLLKLVIPKAEEIRPKKIKVLAK